MTAPLFIPSPGPTHVPPLPSEVGIVKLKKEQMNGTTEQIPPIEKKEKNIKNQLSAEPKRIILSNEAFLPPFGPRIPTFRVLVLEGRFFLSRPYLKF